MLIWWLCKQHRYSIIVSGWVCFVMNILYIYNFYNIIIIAKRASPTISFPILNIIWWSKSNFYIIMSYQKFAVIKLEIVLYNIINQFHFHLENNFKTIGFLSVCIAQPCYVSKRKCSQKDWEKIIFNFLFLLVIFSFYNFFFIFYSCFYVYIIYPLSYFDSYVFVYLFFF